MSNFAEFETKTKDCKWISKSRIQPTNAFKEWLNENRPKCKELAKTVGCQYNGMIQRLCFWFETELFGDFENLTFDEISEIFKNAYKQSPSATLEKFKALFGPEQGEIHWEKYKQKQAYSNSFEYKRDKHGFTKEDYEKYNKSRAVTKENLIQRHGSLEGLEKWENYVSRQSYTKSKQYFIDRFGAVEGTKKFNEISAKKALTLENFVRKYGNEEGLQKFRNVWKRSPVSKSEREFLARVKNFLTFFENEHTFEQYVFPTQPTYAVVDLFIQDYNLVVEFYGDYWHANPKIYDADFKIVKKTSQEIWEYDRIRNETLKKDFGVDLIIVWESEQDEGFERIKEFVEKRRNSGKIC